jgi:dephospho-CoA kinase
MRRLGLTGNIASGKSTVARLLTARGVPVIDADQLAREVVAPGTPGLAAVLRRFGPAVQAADGTLDRAALRRVVFADPVARRDLEAIVHPAIDAARRTRVAALAAAAVPLAVLDIPLLYEAGLDGQVDAVLLVDAPTPVRLARLVRDRGLTAAEAQAMIDAQQPADAKRARARWVLDNDADPAQLAARLDTLWREIARWATLPASD